MQIIKVNETTTLEALGKSFNYALIKFANPQFLTSLVLKRWLLILFLMVFFLYVS